MEVCKPEIFALYALNALSDAESSAFERHLAGCDPCRTRLNTPAQFDAAIREYARSVIARAARFAATRAAGASRRTQAEGTERQVASRVRLPVKILAIHP